MIWHDIVAPLFVERKQTAPLNVKDANFFTIANTAIMKIAKITARARKKSSGRIIAMKSKQEVIKALELCAESVTDEYCPCDDCPYSDHGWHDNESCSAAMKRDAAELLKEATHES